MTPRSRRRPRATTALDRVVADLASGRGGDAAARLVPYGIRFVLLARPADPGRGPRGRRGARHGAGQRRGRHRALAGRLPHRPAAAAAGRRAAWSARTARRRTPGSSRPGRCARRPTCPPEPPAACSCSPTRATTGGAPASTGGPSTGAPTTAGRRPSPCRADGGRLSLTHDQGLRTLLLWVQLAGVVLVAVLALPQVRTEEDDAIDETDDAGARRLDVSRGGRASPRRRPGPHGRAVGGGRAPRCCSCSCCSSRSVVGAELTRPVAATAPDAAQPAARAEQVPVARSAAACPDPVVDEGTETELSLAAPAATRRSAGPGSAVLTPTRPGSDGLTRVVAPGAERHRGRGPRRRRRRRRTGAGRRPRHRPVGARPGGGPADPQHRGDHARSGRGDLRARRTPTPGSWAAARSSASAAGSTSPTSRPPRPSST